MFINNRCGMLSHRANHRKESMGGRSDNFEINLIMIIGGGFHQNLDGASTRYLCLCPDGAKRGSRGLTATDIGQDRRHQKTACRHHRSNEAQTDVPHEKVSGSGISHGADGSVSPDGKVRLSMNGSHFREPRHSWPVSGSRGIGIKQRGKVTNHRDYTAIFYPGNAAMNARAHPITLLHSQILDGIIKPPALLIETAYLNPLGKLRPAIPIR